MSLVGGQTFFLSPFCRRLNNLRAPHKIFKNVFLDIFSKACLEKKIPPPIGLYGGGKKAVPLISHKHGLSKSVWNIFLWSAHTISISYQYSPTEPSNYTGYRWLNVVNNLAVECYKLHYGGWLGKTIYISSKLFHEWLRKNIIE